MKNNIACILIISILFFACKSNRKETTIEIVKEVPQRFQMYKQSELASLMRTMLVTNDSIRVKIIKGRDIGVFDEEYAKIHNAAMTDESQRTETFPTYAQHFVAMQRQLFEVDKSERVDQFNKTVDACISCHQTNCGGPIPRIKKLYIN